jgi:hypothetical protein
MNAALESVWKEAVRALSGHCPGTVRALSGYYPGIFLDGLKKTTKKTQAE